jgi:hypothetical protein
MRKFIVVLALIFLSQTSYAQNKPEYGNWSLSLGGGFGNHVHQKPNWTSGSNSISFYTNIVSINIEKHFGSFFSNKIEYDFSYSSRSTFNSNSFSYIPMLNLRTRGRVVFSLGLRSGVGINNYFFGEETNFILNHIYKIRILLGDSRVYRRDFKGEINLIFEPFYFYQRRSEFWGANRQVRIQYVFPLSK